MINSSNRITAQEIYSVIKTELNIDKQYEEIYNCSFQELHIQPFEINWTLNTLEGVYGLTIKDDGISMQTKVNEFINIILLQAA